MRRLLGCIAVLSLSSVAVAQEQGPRKGSWAAEASSGPNAALMYFRSTTSAWVLGLDASYTHRDVDPDNALPGAFEDDDFVVADLRLGLRRYGGAEQRFRSYGTAFALVGRQDFTGTSSWRYGLGGEMGGAWFFTPNVSLGASADLSAVYQEIDRDFGTPFTEKNYTVQFSGFRLVGAVYF